MTIIGNTGQTGGGGAGGGVDPIVFIPAGAGLWDDADISIETNSPLYLKFNDAATASWIATCMVPTGMTSISSMEMIYYNATSGGNLYLSFSVEYGSINTSRLTDSLSAATYASHATTGREQELAIPSTAYDAITSVEEGGVLMVRITRVGGDANDTYNTAWGFRGLKVTFA